MTDKQIKNLRAKPSEERSAGGQTKLDIKDQFDDLSQCEANAKQYFLYKII